MTEELIDKAKSKYPVSIHYVISLSGIIQFRKGKNMKKIYELNGEEINELRSTALIDEKIRNICRTIVGIFFVLSIFTLLLTIKPFFFNSTNYSNEFLILIKIILLIECGVLMLSTIIYFLSSYFADLLIKKTAVKIIKKRRAELNDMDLEIKENTELNSEARGGKGDEDRI